MRVGKDYFADKKESFLAMEKDYSIIIERILDNNNLMKLLYYTQRDCLNADNLTIEQKYNMINKNILIVPKIDIIQDCPSYVIIQIGNFSPNKTNPEFLDCEISFDILCHPDHWILGDFKLRPYRIAGEIDKMFNKQKLTGIGRLYFMGMDDLVLNDNLMGISISYKAIYGEEDKINPLTI